MLSISFLASHDELNVCIKTVLSTIVFQYFFPSILRSILHNQILLMIKYDAQSIWLRCTIKNGELRKENVPK